MTTTLTMISAGARSSSSSHSSSCSGLQRHSSKIERDRERESAYEKVLDRDTYDKDCYLQQTPSSVVGLIAVMPSS
jgi:hypothetical protein